MDSEQHRVQTLTRVTEQDWISQNGTNRDHVSLIQRQQQPVEKEETLSTQNVPIQGTVPCSDGNFHHPILPVEQENTAV